MKKQGWEVTPRVRLPEGYHLHEDATGLYLYTNNEMVAPFSHFASPHVIRTEAMKHNNRRPVHAAGFTIVELVVVFALILLIIGIAFPFYQHVRMEAALTAYETQVRQLEQAGELHVLHSGENAVWSPRAGEVATTISNQDDTWMQWFDEWPRNPLGTGDFIVTIERGVVSVEPELEQ